MALTDWTPDEIKALQAQGIDPQYATPASTNAPPSKLSTIGTTARAHVGGYAGGLAGMVAGAKGGAMAGAGLGTLVPGLGELGISEAALGGVGGLIGAIGGGIAGAMGGQAVQNKITPDLEEQAALAAEANPKTALATDIVGSALTSGGKPSLNALRSVRGLYGSLKGEGMSEVDKSAAQQTALMAGLNPAINTGISLATGQPIQGQDVAAQVLGGALFSKQADWSSRLMGHGEPKPEVNNKDNPPVAPETTDSPVLDSKFTAKDDNGEYLLGNKAIARIFKNPYVGFLQSIPKDADVIQKGYIQTANEKLATLPVDQMRQMLHDKEMAKSVKPLDEQNDPDYKGGEMPEINNNWNETLQQPTGTVEGNTTDTSRITAPISEGAKIPETSVKPVFTQEVLQKIIDKGATKPVSVQRIFPKLNLTDAEANEALRQADLLAELHENNPSTQGEENATGIRENQGQPSQDETTQTGQVRSSSDMVESPSGSEQSIPSVRSEELSNKPSIEQVIASSESQKESQEQLKEEKKRTGMAYSPQSDYNRYQELVNQHDDMMKNKTFIDKSGELTKEYKDNWTEREQLKKRNGGMPPTKPVDTVSPSFGQSIINGRATAGTALHSIANTPDHEFAPLAREMLEKIDTKSAGSRIVLDKNLDPIKGRSFYNPQTDTIHISPNDIDHIPTIIHEIAHAAIYKKLPEHFNKLRGAMLKSAMDEYLRTGDNEGTKELIRSYYEYAKQRGIEDELFVKKEFIPSTRILVPGEEKPSVPGIAGSPDLLQKEGLPYAMGNLHEFTSEVLSNKSFQSELNTMPSGLKGVPNLWSRFADAVKKLLGVKSTTGSLLERSLKATEDIVGQERPRVSESGDVAFAPLKKGDKVNPELKPIFGRAGRFFQNAIEGARRVAPEVADAYHRFFNARQETFGDVYGRVKNVMEKSFDGHKFSREDGHKLIAAMRQEELTKKPINMGFFTNQAQKQVWNEYKKVYREQGEQAIKDKQPVYDFNTRQFRTRKLSDTSHPLMLEPKVGEILRTNTDIEKVNQLKKDFLDYQKKFGVPDKEAKDNLNIAITRIQGNASHSGSTGNLEHFNANRIAQGIPLPDSWTRNDFEKNLLAYASRNAADRAHFKYIESNPSVMRQLGETHDAWNRPLPLSDKPVVAGNQSVKSLISESKGEVGPQGFYTERAGSSAATAFFISSPALSIVHVPISNVCGVVSLTRNPIETAQTLIAGLKGMYDGVFTARKNGILMPMARPLSDIWDSTLTTAEHFQALGSTIRRIASFNDLATKANVGYMQAAMEFLVNKRLAQANHGEGMGAKTSQQWMRKLDPDYTVGKQYTPDELKMQATRAVGYLHGTNDPRSMPEWMMRDSEISGFFSIAHWSVAQTDRFMRDVWTPATRGDMTPMVMSIFGATIGGYVIKELREKISGKKSPIPALEEIAASDREWKGNAGPLAYNAIAAMQYAGFGGIFSQIAKWPFDVSYKNTPQAAAFPLDEEVTDIAGTISNVASTIANDPNVNYVTLAQSVMSHLLVSDFRLAREGYNNLINAGMITGTLAEKKQLADKMGQLRRFEQVEGLPFAAQNSGDENPYMNLEQKRFKMNQNIGEAMKELPGLVQNILQTYHDNPDVLMSKLRALKENQYSTFPSMEQMPLSFVKYLGYLNREEGPEKAQAELMDYLHHKMTNEVKSSVVP